MVTNNHHLDENEFYFEDDRDFVEYQGCMEIPNIPDPITLLHPDRLQNFRYDGRWSNYDHFTMESQPNEQRPGVAFINAQRVPIHRRTDFYDYSFALTALPQQRDEVLPFRNPKCPYCRSKLHYNQLGDGVSKWDEDKWDDAANEDMEEYATMYTLEYCQNCRYWRWHDFQVFVSDDVTHTYTSFLSKIREFDNVLPEGFTQEFAQWIRADACRWHTMQPKSLEHLVADIMRSTYQSADVMHVGRPDDGGVDVILIESQRKKWLIQVKRRAKAQYGEPVETVRNLLGTMLLEDSTYGMVVSTADHFTFRAYDAACRAREKGMIIELVDRGKLHHMLDSVLPEKPWLAMIQSAYPTIATHFETIGDE